MYAQVFGDLISLEIEETQKLLVKNRSNVEENMSEVNKIMFTNVNL